jgi:hypothetical protein
MTFYRLTIDFVTITSLREERGTTSVLLKYEVGKQKRKVLVNEEYKIIFVGIFGYRNIDKFTKLLELLKEGFVFVGRLNLLKNMKMKVMLKEAKMKRGIN